MIHSDGNSLPDDDEGHSIALLETGFWGRHGSGCLVYARSTGRFLVARRSQDVLEPGTWGTWGGAVPPGMDSALSALRELYEETGFAEDADMVLVHSFQDDASSFRYDNFIAVIADEFEPVLNWENDGFAWIDETADEWPSPLHYGLQDVIRKVGPISAHVAGLPRRPI